MSKDSHIHTQAKRNRESEKARKQQAKAERRAQRRQQETDQFEVVSVEDIVGRLPSSSEAMRQIAERAKTTRAPKTVPCKLFVGSLTDMVTESVLMEMFSKFGKILEASIVTDRNTNQSRGFAFVVFENRQDGPRAIEELDGYELDGKRITVKVATTR